MMTAAGVASAQDSCIHILWFEICPPPRTGPVPAPEIDPASAMAGLTMLAGGLAVLRGRRRKVSAE
jgi:LPXTG-motif cell wall-anchored protein